MKKGDLINLEDHLMYLLDTLKFGVESDFEQRKKRVEKDREKLSELIRSFEDVDVNDRQTELIIIPVKVVDFSKPGKTSMVMKHAEVSCQISATHDSGETEEIGEVVGFVGGGLCVSFKNEETLIDYRLHPKAVWNAVCDQTGRDELILTKAKNDEEE